MKKIRAKLLLGYMFVVIFSILLISVPILVTQVSEIKGNLNAIAKSQMQAATLSINSFLSKPADIVKAAA